MSKEGSWSAVAGGAFFMVGALVSPAVMSDPVTGAHGASHSSGFWLIAGGLLIIGGGVGLLLEPSKKQGGGRK